MEFEEVLTRDFSCLSRPVIKNLIYLVFALVMLLRTPRGWYGKIFLSGIARAFPTQSSLKSRHPFTHTVQYQFNNGGRHNPSPGRNGKFYSCISLDT